MYSRDLPVMIPPFLGGQVLISAIVDCYLNSDVWKNAHAQLSIITEMCWSLPLNTSLCICQSEHLQEGHGSLRALTLGHAPR